MLVVPPHALASRQPDGGESVLSSVPRAFASLLNLMATVVSAGRRGREALPGAGGTAASGAPQLPVSTTVTQLTIPSLPLDPPDQNMQVYGPLVLQSMEPINLTALPLDANGNTVSDALPWWYSTDSSVVFVTKDGQALAGNPGTALLTAHLGTIRAAVLVEVVANSQPYGGQKPDSTRAVKVSPTPLPTPTPLKIGKLMGDVQFINAGWTPDAEPPAKTKPKVRAARLASFGAAAFFATTGRNRPDYQERLPDDETESMYQSKNNVGTPPGKTEPGAPTPPAAIASATETPGSDNFTFSVPAVSLLGRGLDVNLTLTYNSRLWNQSTDSAGGTHMTYDVDAGWPAPGFRLGYGYMEAQGSHGFTLEDPNGTRHQLLKVNPSNPNDYTYESTDGTFIRFVGGQGWGTATYTDGTQVDYGAAGDNPRSYPIKITDRNGNFVKIDYRDGVGPLISTITDTMGRYVRFRYQGNDLVSITVPGYAGGPDRQTIRFYYEQLPIAGTFTTDRQAPPSARVIQYVYFPDTQGGYRYDYSTYGMIYQIVDLRGMTVASTDPEVMGAVTSEGQTAATTTYDYPVTPALLSDAPTYTHRTDDWAGRTSFLSAGPPTYTFSSDKTNGVSTVTAPDGTQTITTTIVDPGAWDDGLVRDVVVKQGSRTFSHTVTTWEHDGTFRNPRQQRVDVTDERNETRSTVFGYTSYNNVDVMSELGFNGEELRRVQTAYETRSQYINRRLVHLPVNVGIYDGPTSTLKSSVDYAYDEAGSNLTRRTDLIMYDQAYNPQALAEDECQWGPDPNDPDTNGCAGGGACDGVISYIYTCSTRSPYRSDTVYRGNLSSVTTYPRATQPDPATAVVHSYTYDIAGNLLTETADCCQQRAYTYEKAFEYAYPTVVARGDAGQLQTRATYDFNTGLVRQTIDENGQATTTDYYPESLRHLKTTQPDGGYTQTDYGDGVQRFVRSSSLIDSSDEVSRFLTNIRLFNGRGDYVRTATNTPDGWATVDLQYDEIGRPHRVSNPYYTAPDPFTQTVNPSGAWTQYSYDGLGRQTQVTTPDGDVAQGDFVGRVATVTDQAGRQRRTLTDALGRVERTDEPDSSGNLGPVNAPTQPTYYAYDVLNDLVTVTQGQQQRFWRYDSMGRLTFERQVEQAATISAPDPESDNITNWSRSYQYTPRSQVSLVVDARGVQMSFTYDGLNRVQQITYSDGTPTATYTYDESHAGFFNQGRLTKVATAAAGTAPATMQEYDYDRMGRVAAQRQHVDVALYSMAYSYNSLNQLKSETYPGGRVVVQAFDVGARLASIKDTAGRTYTDSLSYAPHGGVTSETYGNGAVRQMAFNQRLQPSSITLTVGATVVQNYTYTYGQVDPATGVVDASKNTGQIAKVEDFAGGLGAQNKRNEQRYVYDSLGRLDLAAEYQASDGSLVWRADYGYDRYGNRLQSAQTGNQNYGINYLPVEATDVSATTNRFQFATNNMQYDAAGNVTSDPKFRLLNYEYDGDGKVKRTTNLDGTGETTAVYDGVGQRVSQTAGGETHYFVYDAAGQIIAEYGPNGWERDRVYRGGQLLATDEAVGTCRKTIEQFVESFYLGALSRTPTQTEEDTWVTQLRTAQGQGQSALLAQAQSLGSTLFGSAEYAARQRTDGEFVNDLYWGYLQRAADADGYVFWLNYTQTNGRSATITAFGQSIEFNNLVASLCVNNQLTGDLHWVLTDHLSSVRIVLDSGGNVIGRRDDLPFGDALRDVNEPGTTGPMSAQTSGPTGQWTWSNSIRTQYAAMEKDVPTGLDHASARKYDSGWGRWTSPDPYAGSVSVADPQSFNRYAYVRNDPINAIDPSGLVESDNNFCGAQYSFEQCGGWAGITGGYFGGGYADYQENYGWLPSEVVGDYKQYEQRVMNAMGGNGFLTNEEVNQAVEESFQMRYWVYDDGSVEIEPFHLSPVTVSAGVGNWGFGFGFTGGGSAALGLIGGGAATGNLFGGEFYDNRTGRMSRGVGAGGGIYAGAPEVGGTMPYGHIVAAPKTGQGDIPLIVGGSAGVGYGGFITNARNVQDLKGPFSTTQINTPIGGIQLDTGGGIWVFSVTGGPKGIGGSLVHITTKTAVLPLADTPLGWTPIYYPH
jgi:RHS repeat-associated protein